MREATKIKAECFVYNYFTELPNDITRLIHGMVTQSMHSELMQELSHSVSHFASSCNPDISFVRLSHSKMSKMIRYCYFKPTATLLVHNHNAFHSLVRSLI